MQVVFLGGASGVGASCLAVEADGHWLLIDAGIRVDRSSDRLPDLAFLEDKQLAAIFVTHAHADHIGALPLVHERFPHVPIYTSVATIRLMEVMLADALKVMSRRATEELEIPLYDEALVGGTLRALRALPIGGITSVAELPHVTIHTSRAGHVAGALMLGFETPVGRLVVSGDVSVAPQRTVLGAALPSLRHPDLLILESTYGTRLHPNRQAEEQRLALAVAEGIKTGHVLIPAFALGRAQEIMLILRAAQRDGLIPEFDIWVDGLVRRVCSAYATIPEALRPGLARQIRERGHAFFGRTIRPVEAPAQRTALLDGAPCCIISSSGMLTGGPSAWYARRLAERPAASILITGYQDEEAPGRRLLQLAERGEGTLDLEGASVAVRCRVAQYSLSAHADGAELAGIVRGLRPRSVALVHGDPDARAALAARLREHGTVYLPRDGTALEVRARSRPVAVPHAPAPLPSMPVGIGDGAALDVPGLARLWEALQGEHGAPMVTTRELARAWWGTSAGPAEESAVETTLAAPQPYFSALPGVPGLFRVRGGTTAQPGQAPTVRPDQAGIQASIARLLGDAPDLYHRGVDPNTGAVTLKFHFPAVARERYADALARLGAETGVPVEVDPNPHQGVLAEAALALLPPGIHAEKSPSIHHTDQVVRLQCDGEQVDPAVVDEATRRFQETTGWRLELRLPGQKPVASLASGWEPTEARHWLELNAARNLAVERFGLDSGCYKVGADQARSTLILRFHFPDVARRRYDQELAGLANDTGWRVILHPEPHQAALQAEAVEALPPALRPLGTPALLHPQRTVVVRCHGQGTADEISAAQAGFEAATGWKLTLQRVG